MKKAKENRATKIMEATEEFARGLPVPFAGGRRAMWTRLEQDYPDRVYYGGRHVAIHDHAPDAHGSMGKRIALIVGEGPDW